MKRCENVHTCACSYYQPSTGYCTLMRGDIDAARETIAAACRPRDFLEGAMALEKSTMLQNDVSVLCTREVPANIMTSDTHSISLAEQDQRRL
jgi:hypothetical protein